jgi:hypothetical protein
MLECLPCYHQDFRRSLFNMFLFKNAELNYTPYIRFKKMLWIFNKCTSLCYSNNKNCWASCILMTREKTQEAQRCKRKKLIKLRMTFQSQTINRSFKWCWMNCRLFGCTLYIVSASFLLQWRRKDSYTRKRFTRVQNQHYTGLSILVFP